MYKYHRYCKMQKYLFICNNRFLYNREGAVKPYLAGQIRHREPRFGIASFPGSLVEWTGPCPSSLSPATWARSTRSRGPGSCQPEATGRGQSRRSRSCSANWRRYKPCRWHSSSPCTCFLCLRPSSFFFFFARRVGKEIWKDQDCLL